MSDYIKRSDAIETICRYRCDALPCTINPCGNVAEMLQIPAAPEPPQWVSCKDMLPEPGKAVLVWQADDKYMDVDVLWKGAWEYHAEANITHWMPLPEPPEVQ